jgi:hypothetical protein
MGKTFFTIPSLLVMLLGLPLLGVTLSGKALSIYLEFPPKTIHLTPAPYSRAAFAFYSLFILVILTPLIWHTLKKTGAGFASPISALFPWWGYLGICIGSTFWILAWSRFTWFRLFQPFTFTPLWVGYIISMNALTFRRQGHCLLLNDPFSFLLLFPASAAFWWLFEYLNRFVQNWHYTGVQFSPLEYFFYASLSFSTVLPAFASTREWVASFPALARFQSFFPLRVPRPTRAALLTLVAAGTGLLLLGIYPDHVFPLLWISPLLILVSLQALMKESHVFSSPGHGDWRGILSSALAALVCGFFWEMWNYYSLARWVYHIPFVQRLQLFEMPLLGYAGYLPFGLQCAVVTEMVLARSGKNARARTTSQQAPRPAEPPAWRCV